MKLLTTLALLSLAALPAMADDAAAPVTGSAIIVGGSADGDAPSGAIVSKKMFVGGKEVDPESKEGKAMLEKAGINTANGAITVNGKPLFDAKNPESNAEIQKQIAKAMKDAQPKIQEQIRKSMDASRAKMREGLDLSAEELAAIEPLLARVERLRLQKSLLDGAHGPVGRPMRIGAPGPVAGGLELDLQKTMLGDAAVEPSVQECQDARNALKSLLADGQANAAEVGAAMARIRKARTAFQSALDKAQAELKAVLTPRREALLMDRGILD